MIIECGTYIFGASRKSERDEREKKTCNDVYGLDMNRQGSV